MESLTTALASLSSRDVFLMEIAITVLLLLVLLARYKLWRIRRLLAAARPGPCCGLAQQTHTVGHSLSARRQR